MVYFLRLLYLLNDIYFIIHCIKKGQNYHYKEKNLTSMQQIKIMYLHV